MPIIAQVRTVTPVPPGNHPARCIQIIHFGRIPSTFKNNTRIVDTVRFTFEFPTLTHVFDPAKGAQPFIISKDYGLILSQNSSLSKLIKSWTGKALTDKEAKLFDVSQFLNRECLINISQEVKEGATYSKIEAVSPMITGMTVPPHVNPLILFEWFNKDGVLQFDQPTFDALPSFIQEKIQSSEEYKQYTDTNPSPGAAAPTTQVIVESATTTTTPGQLSEADRKALAIGRLVAGGVSHEVAYQLLQSGQVVF